MVLRPDTAKQDDTTDRLEQQDKSVGIQILGATEKEGELSAGPGTSLFRFFLRWSLLSLKISRSA